MSSPTTETTDDMGELGNPIPNANQTPTSNSSGFEGVPGFAASAPKTSLLEAFSPDHEEVLADGTKLRFAMIDMDTWAETSAALVERRRAKAALRLQANPMLSPQDKEWLLLKLDQEPITFMYAFNYRVQTADGIKNGLARQLMKAMHIDDKAAVAFVKRIIPLRQKEIMMILGDPPLPKPPDPKDKDQANKDPNAEAASTKETGPSMPPSSKESSPTSILGA